MTSLYAGVRRCLLGTIQTKQQGSHTAEFFFPPEFIGFSGHFPDKPILPGIAQIMAALLTAGNEYPVHLVQVKRCKFVRPVTPGDIMRVQVSMQKQDALHAASALLFVDASPCATMSLLLDMANYNEVAL